MIFAGLALFVLKIGNIGGVPVVLCIGVLMLLYGSGREAKGFGNVTAVFGAVYNGLTGWFGDILSYSRLMALMLAGCVIALVFNSLASMPSSGGVTVVSMIVFIIIFLLGHLLNFGLNLLGCFVHDLRLQCLEFFGKFYVDGGKPFRPLEINTRYVDVENHNFKEFVFKLLHPHTGRWANGYDFISVSFGLTDNGTRMKDCTVTDIDRK